MRRQPFLGNQLKPVSTISSPTTLTTATTTTTAAASTSTTSAQTASTTTTTTTATNTSAVPARTPRRLSSSGSSSSRANSPVKAVHLDPIQELLAQHQQIVGNKSAALNSTATTAVQNGVSQNQQLRQNGSSNYSSGQVQPRIRRESTGTPTSTTTQPRIIPQTPLSREKSLNLKNTGSSSSNNNSSELVFSGNNQRQLVEHSADLDSSEMIENNNSKKVRPKSFWASWWRF